MVIDDLDSIGPQVRPFETNSILIIDSDAVLSIPVS